MKRRCPDEELGRSDLWIAMGLLAAIFLGGTQGPIYVIVLLTLFIVHVIGWSKRM